MIISHKSCCFYYFTEILLNLQGLPNATGSGLVEIFYHMGNEEPSVTMSGIIMMPEVHVVIDMNIVQYLLKK